MKLLPKLLELRKEVLSRGICPDNLEDPDYAFRTLENCRVTANGPVPMQGLAEGGASTSTGVGDDYWMLDNWEYSADTGTHYGLIGMLDYSANEMLVYHLASNGTTFTLTNSGEKFISVTHQSGQVNLPSTVNWGGWRAIACGAELNSAAGEGVLLYKYPAGTYAAIPDAGQPRILAIHGPHVLGFNYPDEPGKFAWCSADDIEDWVATATNSAGDLVIREFAGDGIVCAVRLGDSIAAYSADGMALIDYSGAPYYFGYKMVFSQSIGACSAKSVVQVGNYNYGLCKKGFFVTDGVTFRWLGLDRLWETYKNTLSDHPGAVQAVHVESKQEIQWFIRTGSGPNFSTYGLVYNYALDAWTSMSSTSSLIGKGGCIPETGNHVAVQTRGLRIYRKDVGSSIIDSSGTFTYIAIMQTKYFDFGSESDNKYLQAVSYDRTQLASADPYESLVFYGKDQIGASGGSDTLVNSSSNVKFANRTARYFSLDLRTAVNATTASKTSVIQSITFYGKITGGHV